MYWKMIMTTLVVNIERSYICLLGSKSQHSHLGKKSGTITKPSYASLTRVYAIAFAHLPESSTVGLTLE